MIETADNAGRHFRRVETVKMRDPAAPSNFCGVQDLKTNDYSGLRSITVSEEEKDGCSSDIWD